MDFALDHVVIPSEHILDEVAKHYRGKFKATKRQADAAVATLRANGELGVSWFSVNWNRVGKA